MESRRLTSNPYVVSIAHTAPRLIAATLARLPTARVAAGFAAYLDRVYKAARAGLIQLDGQNIFLYQNVPGSDTEVDVAFGVGAVKPFNPDGDVTAVALPIGTVATTAHWGDYAGLANAHAAIIRWCREHGHRLAGTRWEIYGHWTEDVAQRRTDVCYLLESPADQNPSSPRAR